jgi:hypothetical protein
MKVEHDTNFYTDDRYNLTYEELPEKKEKEKQLVLGEWV